MKIIDLHCDTISRLEEGLPADCTLRQNPYHVDLQKLCAGDYMLQTFALFVDTAAHADAYAWCCRLLARFKKELSENQESIRLVTSYAQLMENVRAGRLSALLSIEEGAVCGTDLARLAYFYEQGVRMMTLVWNYQNAIASPNRLPRYAPEITVMAPETAHGLRAFGAAVVEEMNRLSMIIDVSHMGDAGVRDVLRLSKQPVLASHSNARACCPHVRNLPDDLIRGIAEKGGIIGINFCPDFVEDRANGQCISAIEGLLRHIRHLQRIGGIGCIAVGTDFDGIGGVPALADASQMQRLVRALAQDGYTQTEIEKICSKNALRYFREMLSET